MAYLTQPPARRGALRLWIGARFFRAQRWRLWLCSGIRFARPRPEVSCPYRAACHATPLLRRLRDVDMWMQENKVHNLTLAVERLNNTVLLPGEVLSYWRRIGKPTRKKGYVEGMLLRNGKVTADVGGGLCQLSNLLYWMTLHTPLTVVERHRHGYDVFPDADRTQPFGSGATCYYNYLDLMISNGTEHPYRLCLQLKDGFLQGEWYTALPPVCRYEVYEREHLMQGEYWGGYTRHNVLARRTFDLDGALLCDEVIAENHAVMMYSPMLTGEQDRP